MKALKFIGYAVAAVVVLAIAGGAAAFLLIPAEKLAAVAASEVRKATGRELVLGGAVKPSLYPVLGATVEKASLSNAPWGTAPNLIEVGEASVGVRVAPLLSGRIEIEEIRLTDAVIALEVAQDGAPNWVFDSGKPGEAPESGDAAHGAGEGVERLGRVRLSLENAAISYDNRATGASYSARNLALEAALENPDSPLAVEGSGVFNDKPVSLSLNLATPAKLMAGDTALADLSVGFGGAKLAYNGSLEASERGDAPSAKGAISASAPDLQELLSALGAGPIDAPQGTLRSASLDGHLDYEGRTATLSGMALTLDGQTISGEAKVDPSGKRPMITASLMADDLDLSPYMAGGDGGGGAGSGAGSQGWSKEKVDLSALRAADADVSIRAHSVRLDTGTIRNADIRARLRDGALEVTINQLNMFDGGAKGALRLDGGGVPALAAKLDVDSVQLLELLSTLAGFDRLEGIGALSADVSGQGESMDALMRSLRGTSSVKLTDGAILGINLAAMVRNATGAFLGGGGESQKTDFAEISANFAIKNGVATNSDLLFLGPLLRASGAGTIDIGAQSLNYRVTPRAVASLQGQGGDAALAGVAVPVLITGPWSKPHYAPDLAGAITGVIKDPASLAGSALGAAQGAGGLAGDVGSSVGGALGGAVEGLLGGGAAPAGDGTQQDAPAPNPIGGALKGLLGR